MEVPPLTHTAAVVTVSDGVSAGTREDTSGEALAAQLSDAGFQVRHRTVVPDDAGRISMTIRGLVDDVSLVVTTGGTGFGPRDVTPEATAQVVERHAPGMVTLMVTTGLDSTPMAALSRGIVGSAGATLIVNLPGSPRGAMEHLAALLPVIPHALDLLAGDTEH